MYVDPPLRIRISRVERQQTAIREVAERFYLRYKRRSTKRTDQLSLIYRYPTVFYSQQKNSTVKKNCGGSRIEFTFYNKFTFVTRTCIFISLIIRYTLMYTVCVCCTKIELGEVGGMLKFGKNISCQVVNFDYKSTFYPFKKFSSFTCGGRFLLLFFSMKEIASQHTEKFV